MKYTTLFPLLLCTYPSDVDLALGIVVTLYAHFQNPPQSGVGHYASDKCQGSNVL